MMTKERVLELMKQAGLDEKKFWALLAKEYPKLSQEELDNVSGGLGEKTRMESLGGEGGGFCDQ